MAATLLGGIVDNLHIAYRIGYQIAEQFVIGLSRELERPFHHLETMVVADDEMNASLALHFLIQGGVCDTVAGCRVPQFLEERSLIVETCCKSESDVVVVGRYDGQ